MKKLSILAVIVLICVCTCVIAFADVAPFPTPTAPVVTETPTITEFTPAGIWSFVVALVMAIGSFLVYWLLRKKN